MTVLRATEYKGLVGKGATMPHFFVVENKGLCAVKFFRNPQGERALPNEWIAARIADALELPHPEIGAVEIEDLVLPDGKLICTDDFGDTWEFKPGLQLYSQWLENTDIPVASDFEGLLLSNARVLAGAVVLDLLVDNWDRKPSNPNLLLHRAQRQQLYLVDYSMAFKSANWELGNLKNPALPPLEAPLPYAEIPADMFKKVNPAVDFSWFLGKLPTLDRAFFQSVTSSVPSEWKISAAAQTALVDFLEQRAQDIPAYLSQRLQKEVWWL
jgi:hypothetical protein